MDSSTPPQPPVPLQHKSRWILVDWKTLLTEATKIGFLALVVLYSIGFIIWHSYLAKFGVSSVAFLQTEYIAAAICYLFLLIAFAVPPVILFEIIQKRRKLNAPKDAVFFFAVLWTLGMGQVSPLFFAYSSNDNKKPQLAANILICIGIVHFIASLILRKCASLKERRISKFISHGDWFPVYLMALVVIGLIYNPAVNGGFVFSCCFLYVTAMYNFAKHPFVSQRIIENPSIKLLIGTFVILLLINNIGLFGARQFGLIPKSMGGGKPEMAMIRLAEGDAGLVAFLVNSTNTNGNRIIGPVALLLRTDKEVIFIDGKDVTKTNYVSAKQIRADLIQAINYTNQQGLTP
jgi:hypothetical protein